MDVVGKVPVKSVHHAAVVGEDSKVKGVMNSVAFRVITTWTSAPAFRRAEATLGIL